MPYYNLIPHIIKNKLNKEYPFGADVIFEGGLLMLFCKYFYFFSKDNVKTSIRETTSREKSPNSVLREAKLRLRKLEIEAEAVERSYMDFRKRQSQLNNEKQSFSFVSEETIAGHNNLDLGTSVSKALAFIQLSYHIRYIYSRSF